MPQMPPPGCAPDIILRKLVVPFQDFCAVRVCYSQSKHILLIFKNKKSFPYIPPFSWAASGFCLPLCLLYHRNFSIRVFLFLTQFKLTASCCLSEEYLVFRLCGHSLFLNR